MNLKSLLFVPGDSTRKIAKAADSQADALIFDLEDSVAPARKPDARIATATALQNASTQQRWVRINPLPTADCLFDLAAIIPAAPDGIVLPKCESGADLVRLSHYLDALEAAAKLPLGQIKILPIASETPGSVFQLGSYAGVSPRLAGLTWGAEDLPAAIGATQNRKADGSLNDLCRIARSLCLAGAAAANVPAIETVFPNFKDLDGLRSYAMQARTEGFSGMMAIHPSQVAVINAVMTPSIEEAAYARRVIAAFDAFPGAGVVALEGKMLDLPHLKQAQRVLAASVN